MNKITSNILGLFCWFLGAVPLAAMDSGTTGGCSSGVGELVPAFAASSLDAGCKPATTAEEERVAQEIRACCIRELCVTFLTQLICTAYCSLHVKFSSHHNTIFFFPCVLRDAPSFCDSSRTILCYLSDYAEDIRAYCQKKTALSHAESARVMGYFGPMCYNLLQLLQNISFVPTAEGDADCLQGEDLLLLRELDSTSCYREELQDGRKKCFDADSVYRLFSMLRKYCLRALKARHRDFVLQQENESSLGDGETRIEYQPVVVDADLWVHDRHNRLYAKWSRVFASARFVPGHMQQQMIASLFRAIARYELRGTVGEIEEPDGLYRSCLNIVYEMAFPAV